MNGFDPKFKLKISSFTSKRLYTQRDKTEITTCKPHLEDCMGYVASNCFGLQLSYGEQINLQCFGSCLREGASQAGDRCPTKRIDAFVSGHRSEGMDSGTVLCISRVDFPHSLPGRR